MALFECTEIHNAVADGPWNKQGGILDFTLISELP